VVEGWGDEAPFKELCSAVLDDKVLAATGAIKPIERGLYRLQATACP
jgi:hypothetical protein